MVAKNYHYDYYSIEALCDYNIKTYDRRMVGGLKMHSAYPISNGKEVMDALVDMGASISTVLKNQGIDFRDKNQGAVEEIIKKYTAQTLGNIKLQLILEDGYKCWFVQSHQGQSYFDLKKLCRFDAYQNKLVDVKPYLLGGVNLSLFMPAIWTPQWVPVVHA